MDAETFKETMVRHIMNGSTAAYTVTPEDDARIREIAGEQFRSWERIFGRNPKFTIDRIGRFAGGKIQFKLDVQKGIIREAAVYGDFFSTLDASTICDALIGCPYERGAVLEALRSHGIDGAVYRHFCGRNGCGGSGLIALPHGELSPYKLKDEVPKSDSPPVQWQANRFSILSELIPLIFPSGRRRGPASSPCSLPAGARGC